MTEPKPAGDGPGRPTPATDAPPDAAAPEAPGPSSETSPADPPPADPPPADPRPERPPVHPGAGEQDELGRAAEALAAHVADRAAPLAEFGCGTGTAGSALARAGFTTIGGFDPSDENLAAARRTGIYRRLARADPAALEGLAPGAYANAAAIGALDPERTSPQALDGLLALLPPGGCLVFGLPGSGASIGRFRARVIELCEHFVAEPVFRATASRTAGPEGRDLQTTLYVLKKR
jgi:hypothetical protein